MGTFYIKYTNVSHTQNLADVWRAIPILQILDNNLISFTIQKIARRRVISGSNVAQAVIIDSLYKVSNFILIKSSVA